MGGHFSCKHIAVVLVRPRNRYFEKSSDCEIVLASPVDTSDIDPMHYFMPIHRCDASTAIHLHLNGRWMCRRAALPAQSKKSLLLCFSVATAIRLTLLAMIDRCDALAVGHARLKRYSVLRRTLSPARC